MNLTIKEIARHVGGEVLGDDSASVSGIAAAGNARPGELTFAEKPAFLAAAEQSEAAAILVPKGTAPSAKVLVCVANPRVAVARLLPLFFPPDEFTPGVDPLARVAASATVDPSAYVGPGCVVGERTIIDARAVLMGGNHVGRDCAIGEDARLHPNVVIYPKCRIGARVIIHAGTVIGSDGYGYVFDEGRHRKMLQVGEVVIHDDVEIGANTAIDRGALGSTVIGPGTKIDNLVHVAHNVTIGANCLVMGQSGFAGSTKLGDYCVIASQSGIAGHLKLGHQATVGAKSGVMRDVPDKGVVLGMPAVPDKQAKRQMIALQQLPDLIRRTRELEKELAALKGSNQ